MGSRAPHRPGSLVHCPRPHHAGPPGTARTAGRTPDRSLAMRRGPASMISSLRSLRWAAWLGWQLESNWATPWLFVLYSLAKPLAGSMLLVCMYWAARATSREAVPGFLPFLYVSSA